MFNQKMAAASAPGGTKSAHHRPVPVRIGKYEVSGETGNSAPVRLFHAFDRDTGRPVTLKVLTDVADRPLVDRFRREVAIAANLRSAGIIAVYELGEYVGLPFAAMQHVGSETLMQAIQTSRPLTLLEKVRIVRQVAEGLQAAHLGGLTHVGIRPSGIVLTGEGAVIQDFGVVRATTEDVPAAESYLAPEEVSGQQAPDSLCDIFALGVVCYELLGGKHPFAAGKAAPVPLREAAPEVPEALERLVLRALERHRELRYQSLDDFLFDAEPVLRELQRARALPLLAEARRLVDAGELDAAQNLLREILDLDPDNRKAQRLRAVLRDLLQRRTVGPRLEALWREADDEAAARRFDRAVETLQSALRLDEGNAGTKSRLERIRALAGASRISAMLADEARSALEAGDFEQARTKVAEAIEADAGNAEAAGLLREIGEAIVRRREEARVEEEVAKAKSLLLTQSFDEAIAVLEALYAERPSEEVEHWLAHVRTQQAETERQARFQMQLSKAWFLVAERRFAEGVALLEDLAAEFGDEPQVAGLLEEARRGRDRAESIAEVIETSRRLSGEERFEEALETLDAAVARYGDEPSLAALQRETEEQWRGAQATAAVRLVLEEAEWLIGRDRPDLAAEFLREKSSGSSHPDVARRLAEIEALLPAWEKRRAVRDALARIAALEAVEQWSAALTVVEEAIEASPDEAELKKAAERLRHRLKERERERRLGRRLEIISQKMAAQAWPQAFSMIEAARREFPDSPELASLLAEVQGALRRAECESVVSEVRQWLGDGDTGQAEEALRRGLEALGEEPALQALRDEVAAEERYLEDFRTAQVHFGRRRFREAEAVLETLADRGRPDASALLESVRKARAAEEERYFYNEEREKVLGLLTEGRFDEATDLLRKLLALFPGDPILERDLRSIREGATLERPETAPPAEEAPPSADSPGSREETETAAIPLAAVPAAAVSVHAAAAEPVALSTTAAASPRGARWKVIAPAAAGVLLLGGAGAWVFSRDGSTPAAPATAAITAPVAQTPAAQPAEMAAEEPPRRVPAREEPQRRAVPPPPVRQFRLPAFASRSAAPETVIAPPAATPVPLGQPAQQLAAVVNPVSVPPPPPVAPKEAPPATTEPAPAPKPAIGGNYRDVVAISRPAPVLPDFARLRNIHGEVNLEASVSDTGAVTNVRVVNGHPVLTRAAVDAVRRWRFQPATLNGRPMEVKVPVKIQFRGR